MGKDGGRQGKVEETVPNRMACLELQYLLIEVLVRFLLSVGALHVGVDAPEGFQLRGVFILGLG